MRAVHSVRVEMKLQRNLQKKEEIIVNVDRVGLRLFQGLSISKRCAAGRRCFKDFTFTK